MKIEAIEERLGFPLQKLALSELEHLSRYRHRNCYVLDEQGAVLGLNLCENELTDDRIGFLAELPHLQSLNLSGNKLTQLQIYAGLTALRWLDLSENAELRAVEFPTGLPALEVFDAGECALESLDFPAGFTRLQKIELRKNALSRLTFTEDCPDLWWLDASANQLTGLALPPGFQELRFLYLNDNQLESVHFADPLRNLEILHLRGNKLAELPAHLLEFKKLETLYLHGNPLLTMLDVVSGEESGNSWPAVKAYLISRGKSNLHYLRQAKMVLVGNGEVGKTSIRFKLLDKTKPLPKKEERTPGLEIQTYTINGLGKSITNLDETIDFQLNIWDFGGQGKYREVQQLFCSRKTLYLFVTAYDDLPQKEDYVGFEYWLSMVNAYSFDDTEKHLSPVIHVVNKIDEQEQKINELDSTHIFPNLTRFVKISCATLKNFDQLETAIREVLPQVSPDVFIAQFTEFWLAAKAELESRQADNHITINEYFRICANHNLEESEAKQWIRILDRIGTVIYFGENRDLQDWVILNPVWAKDALYKVLDSPLAEGGMLKPKFFPEIWRDYSPDEHQHLIKLMLAYKLCYAQNDVRGDLAYVVPALLNDDPPVFPAYLQVPDYCVKFTFAPFVPAGTVNKLMVMLHDGSPTAGRSLETIFNPEKLDRPLQVEVNKDFMWKNNVVARDTQQNTYAHIWEDWEAKTVYLNLYGKAAEPLFEYVQQMLETVNQTLVNTKYMAPLTLKTWVSHENDWEPLEKLIKYNVDFFNLPTTAKPIDYMNLIQELITKNQLEAALTALLNDLPTDYKTEILALQTRLHKLKSDNRLGLLDSREANTEQNKISKATLDLASLIGQEAPASSNADTSRTSAETSPVKAGQVFISYTWGGDSGAIVDKICSELENRQVKVIRDTKNLGYRGSIKAFMEDIGRGNKVIVVLSKKYLESDNCMFELTQIYQNQDIRSRIFPVVLEDAGIYSPVSRIKYIKYWDAKIAELDEELKSVERGTNLTELQQELNNYGAIRASFDKIAFVLKDMNALNPEIHQNEHFESLYNALTENKL